MNSDFLVKETQRLIMEGTNYNRVHAVAVPYTDEVRKLYARWHAGCQNLVLILGECAAPWAAAFAEGYGRAIPATMIGTLEHIEFALTNGLLISVEDLVQADSFNNLLDQADYLHGSGYFLAAGVLARAVLEAHLRAWVAHASLTIVKDKPTLNDFKAALYAAKRFTATVQKHIDSMAAIGNDAAHNKPELTKDDVTRMLRDVRDFVGKYP